MKTYARTTIASLAAMAICMAVVSSSNANAAGHQSLKYTSVLLRPLTPATMPGMRAQTIDPAATLVEGIRSGDVDAVDEVLDSGELGIDEPICFTMGRAGRVLETDKKSWSLTVGMRQVTKEAIRRHLSGDPGHAMIIPNAPGIVPTTPGIILNTPGVSTFGDSWQNAAGESNPFNMNESAYLHGTPLMVAARFGNRFMVKHLLKRGANPNVFIVVGRTSNGFKSLLGKITEPVSRPYLFALEECYREADGIQGKTRAKMDECANILIAAGAVLPPEDKQGRNGLWDAAIARSIPMLELAVKSGIDVNAVDHLDKSVADYIAESVTTDPDLNAFAKALHDKGAKGTAPEPMKVQPMPLVPGEDGVIPVPAPSAGTSAGKSGGFFPPAGGQISRQDHTAEIAELEIRLRALNVQLDDARHDANMAAIRGTGLITASMRVQNIMQAISETERRLLELQR